MKSKMDYKILDYEMVHWADENLFIAHKKNTIIYHDKTQNLKIGMPMDCLGWKKIGMPCRKARRLFRLDKVMITPIDQGFVLFRNSHIYVYDLSAKKWLESSTRLNCRNPMYNAILRMDNIIIIGEYGNPNGVGKRILKSEDNGLTWKMVYQFKPNEIRHIHCIDKDPYSDKIWIFTGDADNESRVLVADENFKSVEEIGTGGQEWRATHVMFKSDSIHWIMDSPLKEVHHIRYDREKKVIQIGETFAGPVWFAKNYGDLVLAASAQEIGPSHKDKKLHLYMSKDMVHWEDIQVFKHDGWPKGYFRFGTMTLSHGNKKYIFCEGVKGLDGKTIHIFDVGGFYE